MSKEAELKRILRSHDAEFCTCGHEIGWGDVAWNEGQTEAGTPASYVIIQCVECQEEIAWVHSWTWFNEEDEGHATVLSILREDWRR